MGIDNRVEMMSKIGKGTFLNCDGERLHFANPDALLPVKKYHSPYCLLICDDNISPGRFIDTTADKIRKLEEKAEEAKKRFTEDGEEKEQDDDPYKYLMLDNGHLLYPNTRTWRSFHNPNIRYRCIELHTTKSWKVPALSTQVFKDFGWYTAEFDIPYRERAIIDLQADERLWIFDTEGQPTELRVLAYDIETSGYEPGDDELENIEGMKIDIIGWASFTVQYKAKRDMTTGRCAFDMLSVPDWKAPEIHQMIAHTEEEEVRNLVKFIHLVKRHHVIAGHNIMKFDNFQVYNRLAYLRETEKIPEEYLDDVDEFLKKQAKPTNIFVYGEMQKCVDIYPLSFDTFFAARRLFAGLSSYRLKELAKTFNYIIPDRVYLDPLHITIEDEESAKKTLKYNEHDVREQIGVTVHMLPDSLRLCHLAGMSFNDCLPAGTTKIWDHMTFINSHKSRKIMPAICPAMTIATEIFHKYGCENPKTKRPYTKEELSELGRASLKTPNPISEKLLKVLKYGNEAPDYVCYPQFVHNPYNMDLMHAITTPHDCACKACQDWLTYKSCRCKFCSALRSKYPEGLTDKDEQTEFIVDDMKRYGHKEPEEMLRNYALAGKGFRQTTKGYHFPGGMTLHPTAPEIDSHFKMWWGIVVADVGCLHEDTDVLTNRGYVKIKDIRVGDRVLSDKGYSKVTDVRFKRSASLKKIRTSSGQEITCTDEHKFPVVVYDRFPSGTLKGTYRISDKRTDELEIGDRLAECLEYDIKEPNLDEGRILVAELIGIFDAEGSLRNEIRGRIRYDRGEYRQEGIRYTNLVFNISTDEENTFGKRIEFLIKTIFGKGVVSKKDFEKKKDMVQKGILKDYPYVSIPDISRKYRVGATFVYDVLKKNSISIRGTGIKAKKWTVNKKPIDFVLNDLMTVDDIRINKQYKKGTKGLMIQTGSHFVVDKFLSYYAEKDWIFDRKEYCRAYLRGIFSGDGCLNKGRNNVPELTQSLVHDDILEFSSKCLRRCGISHSVGLPKKNKGYGKKKITYSRMIQIMMWDSQRFLDEIGFIHKKGKIGKYNRGRAPIDVRDSFKCVKISSIEKIHGGKVVDITVENQRHPYYYANGLLTHNSMYPSNLKAENIGGDTARFASPLHYEFCEPNTIRPLPNSPYKHAKENYKWIWLRRVRLDVVKNFFISILCTDLHKNPKYKALSEEFSFVNEGYLVAIVVDNEVGGVAKAMSAVLDVTSMIKKQKAVAESPQSGATDAYKQQIANSYQTMKGMRNSGTHGILSAPTVSCRQFNMAGASRITTLGQCVLQDTMQELDKINAKKVYGDSVSGDAKITYSKNGRVYTTTLDSFWKKRDTEQCGVERTTHFDNTYLFLPEYKTPTFTNTGLVKWSPITFITKHPYVGDLIGIVTKSGKSVSVTKQHSIFILINGIQVCAEAGLLQAGDVVITREANQERIQLDKIIEIKRIPGPGHVYDLCVEENHRFFANDIGVKNTDGIYCATSKDARTVIDRKKKSHAMSEALGLTGEGTPFTDPALIEQTIGRINKKWQTLLNYPAYELEIEDCDGMLFVRHKNYIKVHHKYKGDKCELTIGTKGNNFKAKDKAEVATDAMKDILKEIVKEHVFWEDETKERTSIRNDIKTKARKIVESMQTEKMPLNKFTVRQNVRPMSTYSSMTKECAQCSGKGCDACGHTGKKLTVYAARANAIEKLLGITMKANVTLYCFVGVNGLPTIPTPKKSDTKPLSFMWPADLLEDPKSKEACGGVDYEWYKNMVFMYVKGAFGFDEWNIKPWVCTMKQMTLDGTYTVKIVPGVRFEKTGVFTSSGKTLACDKNVFEDLRKGEPVPDHILEKLLTDTVTEKAEWSTEGKKEEKDDDDDDEKEEDEEE